MKKIIILIICIFFCNYTSAFSFQSSVFNDYSDPFKNNAETISDYSMQIEYEKNRLFSDASFTIQPSLRLLFTKAVLTSDYDEIYKAKHTMFKYDSYCSKQQYTKLVRDYNEDILFDQNMGGAGGMLATTEGICCLSVSAGLYAGALGYLLYNGYYKSAAACLVIPVVFVLTY